MYSKIAVLLVNFVLVFGENKCDCDCSDFTFEQSIKESNDITDFYNKLAGTKGSEDERYPVVPPGVVTGALGCQCENLRKKRKITPNEGIPLIDAVDSGEVQRVIPPRFSTRNCPIGRVRINGKCVELEYLN